MRNDIKLQLALKMIWHLLCFQLMIAVSSSKKQWASQNFLWRGRKTVCCPNLFGEAETRTGTQLNVWGLVPSLYFWRNRMKGLLFLWEAQGLFSASVSSFAFYSWHSWPLTGAYSETLSNLTAGVKWWPCPGCCPARQLPLKSHTAFCLAHGHSQNLSLPSLPLLYFLLFYSDCTYDSLYIFSNRNKWFFNIFKILCKMYHTWKHPCKLDAHWKS